MRICIKSEVTEISLARMNRVPGESYSSFPDLNNNSTETLNYNFYGLNGKGQNGAGESVVSAVTYVKKILRKDTSLKVTSEKYTICQRKTWIYTARLNKTAGYHRHILRPPVFSRCLFKG